ncbi:lysosomal alpha-mannosidase-like [Belonocnema kinseyi]|uniref:lysosomal alpha-mannosidase-like n=1 Tax=Belonocnema kinseyi TaxID=2817044 RepID=UPI00143D166C|nr:lysosomal alpha-mannosidase-like [Belonocnema kinseyi]
MLQRKKQWRKKKYKEEVEKAIKEGRVWDVINKEREGKKEVNEEIELGEWTDYFKDLFGGEQNRMIGENRKLVQGEMEVGNRITTERRGTDINIQGIHNTVSSDSKVHLENFLEMGPSILLIFFSVVILSVSTKAYVIPDNQVSPSCGYKACAKVDPKKLNIHIVPHTHDDVGWLKTFDQYYYGGHDQEHNTGVQYILNSVIRSLQESPDRRFIYVESAFFFKWWDQQNEKIKTIVRSLINEGRLEIIGGGWSMNDEAVTHYQSIIDQFSWGFRRLNDTFGQCARPKIGWQIDPFGHSREQASMFAQMGFDGQLFSRIDYQDRGQRHSRKTAEFIWRGSPSLGENANLFTSVLNQYSAPDGFCFDITCKDDPLVDDPDSPEYNIHRKVDQFLNYVQSQANSYKTSNILITMGNDFNYQNADMWYTNLDKLNKYINLRKGTEYNSIYSTPSCYIKAINEENLSWSSKSDDFFPYGSEWNAYWTGYYTSRPTIKFFERMGNNFLQVVKQLSVVSNEPDNLGLIKFREAMGVLQHHDAITGTEKQLVAHDYARLLSKSIKDGEKISSHTLRKMIRNGKKSESQDSLEFYSCPLLNISSCEHTEINKNFVVTVYNPTSQPLKTFIRLPVKENSYQVTDYADGNEVATQTVPISTTVKKIPGRKTTASYELVFLANGIPPLGYLSYYVSKIDEEDRAQVNDLTDNTNRHASKKAYSISVDTTGKVLIESNIQKGIKLTQSIYYYEGVVSEYPGKWMPGNNGRASGAYIFRPNVTTGIRDFPYDGSVQLFRGPLVDELHLTMNEWISQVVRVYEGEERIEFSWLVGPIDINDGIGKEIITKYTTDFQSNGEFLTDSNGREMLQRKRNKRPTWKLDLQEPVAGNYYPVTTKISLSDEERKLKMAILTDRAQGGSSLRDGEIELMVHRRLLCDDNFGVDEPLNETAYGMGLVARGEHSVLIGTQTDSFVLQEKNEALRLSLRPWIFITPLKATSYDDWKANYKMHSFGLAKKLPPNIHILTLEPWKDGSILLRLEHIFEAGESVKYSIPVTINIQNLFSDFTVTAVHETTLGGNQWLEDMERLKWVPDKDYVVGNNYTLHFINTKIGNEMEVLLMPMQIRTFVVNVLPRLSNTKSKYM